MDFARENKGCAIASCCSCFALVLGIVVVAFCTATVEPIEYGLKYNTLSRNIDGSSGVYEGGWYIIGPINKFITFPRT